MFYTLGAAIVGSNNSEFVAVLVTMSFTLTNKP